ncbi:class I SAM-dependent methyltransferase [Natronospirillum operosum]|uniref:tRNA (guanine(46)-N(7))-methyltransferase n=1 Tax=Natronospirillum operosum TaxID=2759953 RepID=A0A4Z0W636_9GAMM|nr:class I SAM-dependent methyltransferase [Natronospirillum operosum]TGG90224.1 class I SAM-dependent methyltransferase [Natronospirillum operosum]
MSAGNSRAVDSNQQGPHDHLLSTVTRFRQDDRFRKPIAPFNQEAFAQVGRWLTGHENDWILDAGCGTGVSTCELARRFPDTLVVGVDRSEQRLRRQKTTPENARFVRADLVDFWRLAAAARWRPRAQYLLYPNPYPKKQQFKQRWHAHPVFPAIVGLGGQLVCRSNWALYVEELALALGLYGIDCTRTRVSTPEGLSAFERKYHASGQILWELRARLAPSDALAQDTRR